MDNKTINILKVTILVALNLCIIGLIMYINNIPSFNAAEQVVVQTISKKGSRGSEVEEIQRRLKKWGYFDGSVDGIFGEKTEKAIRYFQSKNSLTVNGVADKSTLAALGINSSNNDTLSNTDYELLARIISAEARGESYTGQVAVGAVVLNRVESPLFPDTLAGVVYQPGAFTAINDGQIDEPIAESSYRAAKDALNGQDPSGGALYYYNPDKTSNKWIRTRPVITRIGNHLFCS